MTLATAGLSAGIPRSFALPAQKTAFLEFAARHPDLRWVQKSNSHRNIRVLPSQALQLDQPDSFVQQFVERPLLVEGRCAGLSS